MGGRGSILTMVTVGVLAYIFLNSDRAAHGRTKSRESCSHAADERARLRNDHYDVDDADADADDARALLRLAPPEPDHSELERETRQTRQTRRQPVELPQMLWRESDSVDPATGSDRGFTCQVIYVLTILRPAAGDLMDRDALEKLERYLDVLGALCSFFDTVDVRLNEHASAQ